MPETRGSIPARHVAAVVAGNMLEFYDFLTYAFFAVYIGRAFFPSSDPTASLLASLGTFGVGFVTRPIGGFVIGRMGDRLGRKPAMVFSVTLMGMAILGLAVTPPHSKIGIAAPGLVIFFRMVQGFALGGEVGPTTAFLLEAAPLHRRGFYTAFQSWTQDVAVLFSGLVGFTLSSLLNAQQLEEYGWRIAFLVGAAIVPFGIVMRRNLPETFHATGAEKRERVALRPFLPVAVIGLMLLASATINTYVRTYMTTWAITTLNMRANVAFGATVVVGLCGVALDLLGGALSDRIGRKPVMLIPSLALLVLIFPAFHAILHYHSAAALLGATAVLSSFATVSTCQVVTWLSESLPAPIRSGGVSVVYAVAIATFGGTTQYTVAWLIHVTGNPLAPAWYWMGSLIVGLVAILVAHESAPRKVAGNVDAGAVAMRVPDRAGEGVR